MKKNIVFLHLESVSQMAFWQYSAEMPTLFSLMQRSAAFSRFYSASTSSVMSMADLMFGDSSVMDHLEVFPKNRGSLLDKPSNLMQTLTENGYAVYGVQYGSFCLGDAPNNFWGVWPDACGQFHSQRDRGELHRETRDFVEKAKTAGKPFALYFWNMNTHLRDEDPLKDKNLGYAERFRAGYRLLDDSVKQLLDDLAGLGVLQDTLIVAYGDHGDDLWRHGIYRGRSHIIDPYANVSWCPLFIYNNDQDVCISQQMVSMIDLKATIRHMLLPELPPEEPATPFSGINILAEGRNFAFTQSMFALQREKSDPAKAITKSYAVTNGGYRFMVSTGTDIDDNGGMELFLDQWDYGNTRNLLDFCQLDGEGNMIGFGDPNAVHPHFFLTFTEKHIRNLADNYRQLRELLYAFIRQKEQEAAKRFVGEKPHLFPDEIFTRARKRRA